MPTSILFTIVYIYLKQAWCVDHNSLYNTNMCGITYHSWGIHFRRLLVIHFCRFNWL